VDDREALECGGSTPLSHSSICRQIKEWESGVKTAALQRLPPILTSKLNAIGFEKPG